MGKTEATNMGKTEATNMGKTEATSISACVQATAGQVHLGTGDPCRLHPTAGRMCLLRERAPPPLLWGLQGGRKEQE